jgi:hypothetical protein
VSRLPALLGACLIGLAAPVAVAAAPAHAADGDATVTVVHGVRGLVADVQVDGKLVLSGFAPERVTDPLTIPAGTHRVQAWPSGSDPATTPAVVDQTITVTAGERASAAIGLGADGKAVITVFDDAALLPTSGSTALAVRGLAQAGPMRVSAGSTAVTGGLTSTQQAVVQIAPGTYPVSIVPADGSDPAVPAQDVPLVAGRATVLYLIGKQADNTLGWVAQTVQPASATAAPLRVNTGVGPVPAAGTAGTTALVVGLPVALLGAVAVRRRRALA